jgi:hypothetical protein
MTIPGPYIRSISEYIEDIDTYKSNSDTLLFRGQNCKKPLIPKIARSNPEIDTTVREKLMLNELKRRTARNPSTLGQDDWDALVVAQHFGMSTRLLDWSTNPLTALWFAISDLAEDKNSYVFMLRVTDDLLLDRTKEPDPFAITKTKVFKPSINNERIASQAGWFTAHRYSKINNAFVALENNTELKERVLLKGIREASKAEMLRSLDRLGINQESLFPGLEGVCKYVDGMF